MMQRIRPTPLLCVAFLCSFYLGLFTAPGRAGEPSAFSLDRVVDELLAGRGADQSGALLLEKGEEALLARSWLAQHAERRIDVQYFIWSTDNIGILAAEALLRAADRGVQVRVIVDDLLIDAPTESMLALATHPNIQVKIYNPKHHVGVSVPERIFHMLTNFRSFNQRMHDKTFMVDGRVAITGGRNMADEYFDYDHQYNFRDREILLLGPVVSEMENNFETFWLSPLTVAVADRLPRAAKNLSPERISAVYANLHRYAADPENFAPEVQQALTNLPKKFPTVSTATVWDEINFIHDLPGKNDRKISLNGGGQTTRKLAAALTEAKKSITIQSPYLIMPPGAIDFFGELAAKGVDIRICTNSLASTDNLQAFSGYAKQRQKILKAGIKVFEFRPNPEIQRTLIDRYRALEKYVPTFAIHAKTMVIDGKILFVGTFNLDPRSANLNTEVGVLVRNEQLASQAEQSIHRDMLPANSWNAATDDPDTHAGISKRLQIAVWRIFPLTPLL